MICLPVSPHVQASTELLLSRIEAFLMLRESFLKELTMSEQEKRHGTASLTSRVMDLARTSIEALSTRTLRQALRASIELGKLGITMRALSDIH